ncbi:unnamed protein product [Brachionus calyciflorus]|uniref:Uncharacterized protein n=1 Tax=Brachionus calyciflorus TaxID=104777 RepID=A0A814I1L0_9BILA|nr:unnamed protein product [Brachionus calyciflorus]
MSKRPNNDDYKIAIGSPFDSSTPAVKRRRSSSEESSPKNQQPPQQPQQEQTNVTIPLETEQPTVANPTRPQTPQVATTTISRPSRSTPRRASTRGRGRGRGRGRPRSTRQLTSRERLENLEREINNLVDEQSDPNQVRRSERVRNRSINRLYELRDNLINELQLEELEDDRRSTQQ